MQEFSELFEIVKEFVSAVAAGTGEELLRLGSSAAVTVICLLAFGLIGSGIFAESRSAVLCAVSPGGKEKPLGTLYVRETGGRLRMQVPERLLEKSESIYYVAKLPMDFAGKHYMEELFLELPSGIRRMAVKRQIRFQVGLEWKINAGISKVMVP